jgi:hypothetical protein
MRTKLTTILAAALAGAILAAGCVQQENEAPGVADAIPTADQVQIRLPDGPQQQALGQIADFYVLTRGVTVSLNAGAAWVLILVHAIVQLEPTSVDGNVYTWGPWDGNALDPARYRLVVTANADGTYDWALDGQSKTSPGPFITVISGHAVPDEDPGVAPHRGSGDFFIDFDAGEQVNPIDNTPDTGNVLVTYDLAAKVVTMHAEGVDALANPASFDYFYDEQDDGSGDFQFAIDANFEDSATPATEQALIRSRWQPTGAGRSDAMVSGGDLGEVEVSATECWDTRFRRVYYADSGNWLPTEGNAADCAYADAAMPDL